MEFVVNSRQGLAVAVVLLVLVAVANIYVALDPHKATAPRVVRGPGSAESARMQSGAEAAAPAPCTTWDPTLLASVSTDGRIADLPGCRRDPERDGPAD